jgi:hypothetical protein
MALLSGLRLIIQQDLIDDPQPRSQFRTLHGLLPPIPLRQRKLQHPPNRFPRQPELPRRLPDAHTVHLYRSSYARIHFHLVHLPGVSQNTIALFCSGFEKCGGLLFDRHKLPLTRRFVVYYCSAVYSQDPEMVFELVPQGESVVYEPFLFQQALPPVYQEVYATGSANDRLKRQLTAFALRWDQNIGAQGFVIAAAKQKAKSGREA